ncbi:hypothetical protein [Streptomyces sp. NPDC050164]|uniref:hypothetical protein n=1 Tax=Streptomyces sp. NPDC050164 TaxID=3365605 RepID=UPI0037A74D16
MALPGALGQRPDLSFLSEVRPRCGGRLQAPTCGPIDEVGHRSGHPPGRRTILRQGTKSPSQYDLGTHKLSNGRNDMGMDPGSSYMGLNYDRPGTGTGTEPLVGNSRGTYACPANR